MDSATLDTLLAELAKGTLVPYLGPGVLGLVPRCPVPATPETLVAKLVTKGSVPHKLLKNLTAAAQFIENFKHRKTVVTAMNEAFRPTVPPSSLHHFLAASMAPLIVHVWYDNLMNQALSSRSDWGVIQALSQSEHFGHWTRCYGTTGEVLEPESCSTWNTILYEPIGSVTPTSNYLVSDTDYVEVLTEIDIQTPIPERIQELRKGRHFLYLGCRFDTQLQRIFAHQISKRSSDKHWAVIPHTPSRNELRFMEEHGIERIDMSLEAFAAKLMGLPESEAVPASDLAA